jgi:hypothetical protein
MRKTPYNMLGVKIRMFYHNKCAHVKHEVLFVQIPHNYAFQHIVNQDLAFNM